ncbi:DUF7604 domain-containing protein [Bifidobacterium callitrichidarum]|uniref:VWFA domain-containing protein n=1 Tax=Bifidobacterium callitrichidarum TaxID=2052941 RepID=A0A2U2NCE6_9BIFI|nr:InlB B-repeat-containing protein [Bifidobacterium callitrichidarum]PWG66704.1 hypothetical protein DF196_02025 [Bifidobacterium callitrichidarum]
MKHGFKTLTAIIAGTATLFAAGVPAAMADDTPTLGVPIHSRQVKATSTEGVYAMTYELQGKSLPSVVHLGGDVIVAYDSSGSMGALADTVKKASSDLASKSLADPNSTLPEEQQNKVAFTSMYDSYSSVGGDHALKNTGSYWNNKASTFKANVGSYSYSCVDCDALGSTFKYIKQIADTARTKTATRDVMIITDGGSTDEPSTGLDAAKAMGAPTDGSTPWRFHLVQVGSGSGTKLPATLEMLKKAGIQADLTDEDGMSKLFDEIGKEQATSWRVANTSIVDEFGPYVDPTDVSEAKVTCTDRDNVDPGEDATGCSKAPKAEEVKTTWDDSSRTLKIAWPSKGEIGAKAIYKVTVNVKVNADGIKHYEDSGYKYDGDKGDEDTGAISAGKEGYKVSKDKAILNYEFFRNGESIDDKKTTEYATPVVQVGTLESSLSYDANGGEGTMDDQTGEHASSVKAQENEFKWKGHRFVSWNTQADGSGSMVKPGDDVQLNQKTQTLYAQWTTMPATVSYDKNSGAAEGTTDGSEGLDGDEIDIAENGFTWAGRTFMGWNTQADGKGDSYKPGDKLTMKEGDLVLYAQWKANGSTLSYLPGTDKAAGETPSQEGTVDEEVKVAENGFTWSGHTFLGWKLADASTKSDKKDSSSDKTDSTKDESTSDDTSSEGSDTDSSESSDSGDTSSDSADSTDKPSADESASHTKGTIQLIDSKSTDDTGKDSESTDSTDESTGASKDDTATDDSSKKDDSTSDDKTDKDTTDKKDDTTDKTTTDDVVDDTTDKSDKELAKELKLILPEDTRKLTVEGETLEAVWRANKYTIKFDKNDDAATGDMDDQSIEYDQTAKLTANKYEYALHNFKGWNTKADGSGTTYKDEAEVTNLVDKDKGEITLYAQWEAQPLPLTGVAIGLLAVAMAIFGFVGISMLLVESKRRRG